MSEIVSSLLEYFTANAGYFRDNISKIVKGKRIKKNFYSESHPILFKNKNKILKSS